MLDVEKRFVIQDLHRQGVSIAEISQRTGHDRRAIRRVINAPVQGEHPPRCPKNRKIDPYVPHLRRRTGAGVWNARKLYHEISDLGYHGRETQARSFVQPYRKQCLIQST